jgi:hypothetical protein
MRSKHDYRETTFEPFGVGKKLLAALPIGDLSVRFSNSCRVRIVCRVRVEVRAAVVGSPAIRRERRDDIGSLRQPRLGGRVDRRLVPVLFLVSTADTNACAHLLVEVG